MQFQALGLFDHPGCIESRPRCERLAQATVEVDHRLQSGQGLLVEVPVLRAAVRAHAIDLGKEGVRPAAEKLYADLQSVGIEVLFDDRNEKAGVAFSDADLIGAPWRLILSARTLSSGSVELKDRKGSAPSLVALD
jgi:prolyl-tRNA synthetase